MNFKPLTEAEIKKMGRMVPVCGTCFKQWVQVGEFQWKDPCGSTLHIATIGGEKEKKTRKKKV